MYTSSFEGLLSLAEASTLYNKEESTLRHNIRNGKFIEDIDCKKFGKQWVFRKESLDREYGYKGNQ